MRGQGGAERLPDVALRIPINPVLSLRAALGWKAISQFCKWMVADDRWRENPLPKVARQNVAVDRRHDRRALSADELRWLIDITAGSEERFGMPGAERALAYRLAAETGLRAAEIASLVRASFNLSAEQPTVVVEAGNSKRRRRDELPLRPSTAAKLAEHLEGKHPGAKAFHLPGSDKTSRLFKADLDGAQAEWHKDAKTPQERAER